MSEEGKKSEHILKKHPPTSQPPPLFQASLVPIVSKSNPDLRRSPRVHAASGCQASGSTTASGSTSTAKKVSASSSYKPLKASATPLTDFFRPIDVAQPASAEVDDTDVEVANLFDADQADSEEDNDEPLAPLPVPPQAQAPSPPPPHSPVHIAPPSPALQIMADAGVAVAAAAAAAAIPNTAGIPPPPAFSGDTTAQCPQEWIRRLRYWLAFRNLTPPQITAAIPVLLTESALIFYQGLADGEKDTLDHFEQHFLQHYKTEGTLPWLDLAALWGYKQSPAQTVEQYLNEISRLALRTNAAPPQVLQAALSGLAPQIRAHLVLHDVPNFGELRNKAMLAEKSLPQPSASNDVTDALKAIQSQLTALKVHATEEPRAPSQNQENSDRSRPENRERRPNNFGQNGRSPYRSFSASARAPAQSSWQRNDISTSPGPNRSYQPRVQFQTSNAYQPPHPNYVSRGRGYQPGRQGYVQQPFVTQQYRGGRGHGYVRGSGQQRPGQFNQQGGTFYNNNVTKCCNYCGIMGHISRDCYKRQNAAQ